jgi:CheY-like chemotaxis protein
MAKKIRARRTAAPLSTVESVPINDLIHEHLKQLWNREPYKLIEYEFCPALEESYTVRASWEWLRQVLDIIIDNAVEAMDKAKLRKLSIATHAVDNNLEVVIRDTGRGIPRDILPTLLEEPIQHPPGSKGSGMGLLMARMVIQTYGGDIRIDSTGLEGTTMIVWLPIEDQKVAIEKASGKAHFLLISSSHEHSWLRVLEDALAPLGTLEIQAEREVIRRVAQEHCDIIIVDATSTEDFSQLIAQIRKRWLDARIVVITALSTWEGARQAFRSGALDYISKSMSIQDVRSTFAHILRQL